jgi:hypothetical protein
MMTDSPVKPLVRLAEQMSQLDPARLAALVSLLPPEQLVAVAVGLDVGLLRAGQALDERLALDYDPGGRWHRVNDLLEIRELDRHRYPPNGDRAEWVTYGPAGRPSAQPGRVAA